MSSVIEKTLQEAIDTFRGDLAIRRSPHTVEAYSTALNHFAAFCRERHQPPEEMPVASVTADMALSFVRWLQDNNPVSATTLDNYLTALTRFYNWLMVEGIGRFEPGDYARLQERLANLRGRRPPRPLPHIPAEEAVRLLLAAAYAVPDPEDPASPAGRRATLRQLRNIALLETLRSTGARVGEIVALRRGDLDHERSAAMVMGKGRKQRLVYFDEKAWIALTHYLQARQDGTSGRSISPLPVFARHDRGAGSRLLPVSTNTVRAALNSLCKLAGLDQSVTPHLFRHRFATKILGATHDLAATQDLLGHASPTTTRIYARLTDEEKAEAHRKARDSGQL